MISRQNYGPAVGAGGEWMNMNRSIPPCSVIPEVAYPDVTEGAAWLQEAFGFEVRIRIGNHRVQMRFGDGALVVIERAADDVSRNSILLRVEDADAIFARAVTAGARVLREPRDYPYGERQANLEDFAGNRWTLTQSIADVHPAEWGGEPGPAFEAEQNESQRQRA
jgi:uncharacterized glyoxalase superfamily protein PhnB